MNDDSQGAGEELIQQVVSIVAAYVSHNSMRAADLPDFIGAVHTSMRHLAKDKVAVEAKPPESPAVPVKRSVNRDFIVCLDCGKKFKSLRRHLSSFHGQTPDEYRMKWGLLADYPMVAPAYSATRSQLAKDSGLGQVSRSSDAEAASKEETAEVEVGEVETAEVETAEVETAHEEAKPDRTAPKRRASAKAAASKAADATSAEDDATSGTPIEDASAAADEGAADAGAVEQAEPVAEPPVKAKRGRPRKVPA